MADSAKENLNSNGAAGGNLGPAFVAVGQQGQRIISKNGADWTNLKLGQEGEYFRGVSYNNGRIVAAGTFGGKNIFATSTDGIEWKSNSKEGQYKNFVRGLSFGNNEFIAIGGDPGSVGSSSPFVLTSKDGVEWSDYAFIAGKNIIRRIVFGNGMFVGVGDRGRRAMSKDGKDWKDAPEAKALDTLVDVAFGKGIFVGVGLHSLRLSTEDGLKWGNRQIGEEGEHLNSIVWAGDRFVAVGMGATYISPDGITWKREVNKDAPLVMTFGNGTFVGLNWRGRILRSTDGIQWTQVHKCDFNLDAVTFGS